MTKLQDFLNSPITQTAKMHRNAKAGDLFGVELECEGRHVMYDHDDDNIIKHWAPHHDGSLRDNHGGSCEWVFNGPVTYAKAVERVGALFDYFKKKKAKLVTSNRTSTHVHFNMSDKTTYQLVNMFILFTILEGLLDRYCGEDRAGNLFCLSSRHAERQLDWVMDACFKHYNFGNIGAEWRYCSFNIAAINKFGSVEFRGMRGLDNEEDMLAWLDILREFCDYSCYKMRNPVEVVQQISAESPIGFLSKIFSKKNVGRLIDGLSEADINASVYEGLRLVQMMCYKIGTEFDQVRLRGRDFWSSFKDDKEPQLDIDPEVLKQAGVQKVGRAVRPGRAPRPIDPFEAPAGAGINAFIRRQQEQIAMEQLREAARIGPGDRIRFAPNEAQWIIAGDRARIDDDVEGDR